MKNFIQVFFAGLFILTANASEYAQSPPTIPHIKAVKILTIRDGSIPTSLPSGRPREMADPFRHLIGHAIGSGAVNSFVELEPNFDEGVFGFCAESPLNEPVALTPPPPSGPPTPVSPPSPAGSLDSSSPLEAPTPPDPNLPALPITDFDDLVANLRLIQKPGFSVHVEYVEHCDISN